MSDRTAPGSVTSTAVRGVTLHQMVFHTDGRGTLSAGQFPRDLPFLPHRYFVVYGVPATQVRGEHAHRRCHQLLVCVRGRVTVLVDDSDHREEIVLDRPDVGLYLPPVTWGAQRDYSEDALLLVLASEPYDVSDYIDDYEEFRSLARHARGVSGS